MPIVPAAANCLLRRHGHLQAPSLSLPQPAISAGESHLRPQNFLPPFYMIFDDTLLPLPSAIITSSSRLRTSRKMSGRCLWESKRLVSLKHRNQTSCRHFLPTVPSPSYGVSTSSLIVQTQVPDDSSSWTTPTPSPVSPNAPLLPVDGMSWKDRPKRTKSRSKKDKEASLRRRKTQGPGEYVCDVCGDDFTAMHRLQGRWGAKSFRRFY